MSAKKRFLAMWSSLSGAFHDADTAAEAIAFARAQGQFNSRESTWAVTDKNSGSVVAQGGAWT